ncbi:PRA1 family protein D-like [Salvia divinorum]|uniref:PRA1 family protein n=1 Tax=Salvia divinorum TaxID=28513 RepID=A0ABD1GS59_SALDI
MLRPWPQFLDQSALRPPVSLSESTHRVTQNLRYFLPNYVVLTLIIFLVTLLTRPHSLLFFLCLFAAWAYLVLASVDPLTNQRFAIGFLAVATFGALFWTRFWVKLFLSLAIGAVLALVHGVLRLPGDSIEDSPYASLLNAVDNPRGGYASF